MALPPVSSPSPILSGAPREPRQTGLGESESCGHVTATWSAFPSAPQPSSEGAPSLGEREWTALCAPGQQALGPAGGWALQEQPCLTRF